MFTHEQTLTAINAGLRAVGRRELDGIPRAAPQHADKCVLGCAYDASLCDYGEGAASASIDFPWADREQRDAILAAWQEHGVVAMPEGVQTIQFGGGLAEWMRAFDGGVWRALIVAGYDGDNFTWEEYPGEETVPIEMIEPEYYAAGMPEAEAQDWSLPEAPAAGPHPGCAEFADDRDL